MKKQNMFLAFIAAMCLLAGSLFAGETNSFYGREFGLSAFGTYQATGAVSGDSRYGAGIQADYFFSKNVGVTLATSKSTFDDGAFFENLAVGPVLRLPVKATRFAPYVLGGVGFAFNQQNDRYYYLGGGVEYRATQHASVFTDIQYQWRDRADDGAVVRAGLRWVF